MTPPSHHFPFICYCLQPLNHSYNALALSLYHMYQWTSLWVCPRRTLYTSRRNLSLTRLAGITIFHSSSLHLISILSSFYLHLIFMSPSSSSHLIFFLSSTPLHLLFVSSFCIYGNMLVSFNALNDFFKSLEALSVIRECNWLM